MDGQQYADTVRDTMSELTAEFSRPSDIAANLRRVTSTAVEMMDGVHYADILLISEPDTFRSVAATDQIATDLDAVQQRFREGPCLDAAVDDVVVLSNDLTEDRRWPRSRSGRPPPGCTASCRFGFTPTTPGWAR